MTLLAPLWFAAGVAGALGVLALHFIARMRPAPMVLPTARFVPDMPARAASRAPRPTDLLLLMLRVAAALLLGLAFAGPIETPRRAPVVRVIALDRSAAVGNQDSAAARARALLQDGDVLVAFDTTATVIAWESGTAMPPSRSVPADLAAALLVAIRAAHDVAARADSVELVLVSALDRSAWSSAVLPVRGEWDGAIRIERVAAAAPDSVAPAVTLRGQPDDPLRATMQLLGRSPAAGTARVRVIRAEPTPADTAWARDSGGVLVHWPAVVRDSSGVPAGAVAVGDGVAMGPWIRVPVEDGTVLARWADGDPAATEVRAGSGCVRHVGVGIPSAGDAALSRGARLLASELTATCAAAGALGPVPDSLVRQLAGPRGAVSGRALVRAGPTVSPATPWLLAAAVAVLLIEWALRDRSSRT